MQALVVDDSRAMRMILRRVLEGVGYEVSQAADGREALELLQSRSAGSVPDLALVDWNMPDMNGLELIEAVRGVRTFDAMRIIMCTTETEPAQMALALLRGADEYVAKPFTADVIIAKMSLIGLRVAP